MTPPDPVFLATATEIVLRAGEIQMARRESGFRIDKKGAIDLGDEIDRALLGDVESGRTARQLNGAGLENDFDCSSEEDWIRRGLP